MTFKKLLFSTFLFCLSVWNAHSQHAYFSPIQFNVEVNTSQKASGGLKVSVQLGPHNKIKVPHVGLDATTYQEREQFSLMITVSNDGPDDIMISDWTFRAICPQNNMGLPWQETSSIPLVTPYVPNDIYLVLKPGEKKTFPSAATDFYWCLPKDETALLTLPRFVTAVIICATAAKPNQSNPGTQNSGSNSGNASNPGSPFEPSFEEMMQAVKDAYANGNDAEAEALKKEVLEIASHVYPDRMAEIRAMVEKPKPIAEKPAVTRTKSATQPQKAKTDNQSVYSNWLYINSDKAVQERFSLAYEEGDFGYFNVQIRVNHEADVFCRDARCEGYIVAYGYPDGQGKDNIYKHFRIYNSYTDVYEFAEPIPIRLRFSDGSKRLLRPEGFFYTTSNNPEPMPVKFLMYSCVDEIISGMPKNRCSGAGSWRDIYKDSEALILK